MSIQKAYNTWAATYNSDRNLTRDLDAKVSRELLGPKHYPAVLELGCGTGKNTPLLAQISKRVLSLDFSEAMIRQAKIKRYPVPAVFALADLTQTWPCAAGSVQLVTCNLVLEHIADLEKVFAQARRVLVAGGHLFICELHPAKQYQGRKAVFEQGGEQVEIAAYVHHLTDYLKAAEKTDFSLRHLGEWWHDDDDKTLAPRLVSFLFES